MISIYVDGTKLGSLVEVESLIPTLLHEEKIVELHDETSGKRIATLTPEPIFPWEPTLTRAEINRRIAEGGMSLAEFRAKVGIR